MTKNQPKKRRKGSIPKAYLLTVFILAGLIVFFGCNTNYQENGFENLYVGDNQPNTDSLVVDQLIQRSESFYNETGTQVDPFDSFLKEALEITERRGFIAQEAVILNIAGRRYRDNSRYGEALKYHHRALDKAKIIENAALLAEFYNQIGVVYRRTDDNAIALDMHFKALQISEEIQDTFNISVAINSIGNVNFNLERYHTAIEYFIRSLDYSFALNNETGKAINTHNIGECMLKLGQPDSALTYYYKSLEYNTKTGDRKGQSICFSSIGAAYIQKGDLNQALEFLNRSLNINQKLGDLLQVAITKSKIGEVYLRMEEYNLAEPFIIESLKLSQQIGSRFQAEESSRLLSMLHEKTSNHQDALDYYKLATTYRDSIINEKNMHHLTTMEAMLEAENQRNKINRLNVQTSEQSTILNRQRLMLTVFIVLISIMVILTSLLVYQHRLRNKYNNLKNQHKLLRSQMNPHFIFNALSAIQVYILEHDVAKSTRFLTDFAKLMRLVLKTSHYDYIPLNNETQILKYYLELQKLRFMSPFNYHIHIDASLDAQKVLIPPMLTQPFVENAVEHGIKEMEDDGHLDIRFKVVGKQMVIEIEDNGVGINVNKEKKQESDDKHESMAIKITRERLDVIRNDSGGKVNLEIIDKKSINPFDRGTLIRIFLPVVKQETTNKPENGLPKSTNSR